MQYRVMSDKGEERKETPTPQEARPVNSSRPAEARSSASRHAEPRQPEETLTLLGSKQTTYPTEYTSEVLEAFDNKYPERDYWVKLVCPEFTSLCPITSQPDFAELTISYIPDRRMVESKSLKLYLFSFRNHGAFHESCINMIMEDLIQLMSPRYIEVRGAFTPRGGIAIHPFCNWGKPGTKYEELAEARLSQQE